MFVKPTAPCAAVFHPSGQQFGGQIIPSATVLVVGVGRTEAKVEGLFSEVCRLEYKGSVFASMGGEVLKGARERQIFAMAELEQRNVQPELWRSLFPCFCRNKDKEPHADAVVLNF